MYYVYVLQSQKDGTFYTGFTNDLNRRTREHNAGLQVSTRGSVPLKLVYYEWCLNKNDAVNREKYLKSGMGKKYIKNRIRYYLNSSSKT